MIVLTTTLLFLCSFVSLSLWFLYKESKEMRNLFGKAFLASLALYLGIVVFVPGIGVSWSSLAMNMLFLFVGGFFLNSFSKSKIIFIPMMILLSCGYYFGVKGIDWFPFSEKQTSSPYYSDPNNELLLEVSNGHQLSELQGLINKYHLIAEPAFTPADEESTELDDYFVVDIPSDQIGNFDQIVEAFKNSGLIDHIETNEVLSLDPTEKMATFSSDQRGQYSANDPDIDKVWGFSAMNVDDLYQWLKKENIQPVKKARIAIIDTGVDSEHEDLKDNFVSVGARHNIDEHSHGTHCAGIAAAVSNNEKGIASFSPNRSFVEVTSVKVFGKYGNTTQRKIIEGMLLAADNGADVLSMSLGGPSTGKTQRAYKQAVKYANSKGAIVVVAAGNENIDARKRAPASVDGVITVSAVDENLDKADFSNDVSNLKMGIAAPGVQVYSTIPNNNYEFFNGTSMATPYVAGLLGLMKSLDPELSTRQAFRILKQTGRDTRNTKATGLLINPVGALKDLLKK